MSRPHVVTANALHTGAVVYLDAHGNWVEALDAAAIAIDDAALRQLEATATESVNRCEITSVYAFDVQIVGGRPVPLSVRETIRAAHAPTV